MTPADIIGFFLDIITNPFKWLFIVFWSIYAKSKKRWAKITAIIFSCLAALAFLGSCLAM